MCGLWEMTCPDFKWLGIDSKSSWNQKEVKPLGHEIGLSWLVHKLIWFPVSAWKWLAVTGMSPSNIWLFQSTVCQNTGIFKLQLAFERWKSECRSGSVGVCGSKAAMAVSTWDPWDASLRCSSCAKSSFVFVVFASGLDVKCKSPDDFCLLHHRLKALPNARFLL